VNNIVKDQHIHIIQHDFQECRESHAQENVYVCQNMDLKQHNEIVCSTFVIPMKLNIIILNTIAVLVTCLSMYLVRIYLKTVYKE